MTELLARTPTTYCVSSRDFAWDLFTGTGFFTDSYRPIVGYRSAYDNRSPLTVWRYAHDELPESVDATFGSSIKLISSATAERLAQGESPVVRLYWQAAAVPPEDYVVFVHLLDPDGGLVAGHDGAPSDGLYPTSTWQPGDVVPDIHRMELKLEPAPGTYLLWVGMYAWPSIERLPVRDARGIEQINSILLLKTIEVE